MRCGRYTFHSVTYDPPSDVLHAAGHERGGELARADRGGRLLGLRRRRPPGDADGLRAARAPRARRRRPDHAAERRARAPSGRRGGDAIAGRPSASCGPPGSGGAPFFAVQSSRPLAHSTSSPSSVVCPANENLPFARPFSSSRPRIDSDFPPCSPASLNLPSGVDRRHPGQLGAAEPRVVGLLAGDDEVRRGEPGDDEPAVDLASARARRRPRGRP